MNIKQLETFVRIVEHGSFANAAKALNTTQSTVSVGVNGLGVENIAVSRRIGWVP